jgi:hypothetical protein
MRLASVVLARIYGMMPIEDLNPNGAVYYPEVVEWLKHRFNFLKFPTKLEDFDESKGIEFGAGRAGDATIEKLVILNSGIYLDTLASTDVSERILNETLTAAVGDLGIFYEEGMIKRKAYISQLAFYSDAPIMLIHPVFIRAAAIVSKEVEQNFGKSLPYHPTAIGYQYDLTTSAVGPAAFNIQRREGAPFSDNKFFSVAPVKTSIHLELLNMIEKAAMDIAKG